MKKLHIILFFCAFQSSFGQQPIAFTHINVIDVKTGVLNENMTVVIIGNRITDVTKTGQSAIPQNAQVVNASGKFLIPGLWDMHVHALNKPKFETFLPLMVVNGVTGIRDMATNTPLEEVNRWKKQIDSGSRVGPRIVASGLILDGPKPLFPTMSIAIKDEMEGRNAVRRLKEQGADFIKVYSGLPRDVFYAITDEAKKQGLSFAGHLPTSITACEASEVGQRSLEHMLGWFESCSTKAARINQREKSTETMQKVSSPVMAFLKQIEDVKNFDTETANEMTGIFIQNDTYLTPTITARESATYYDEKITANDTRLKYISPSMINYWQGSNVFSQATADQLTKLKAGFSIKLQAIEKVHQAGGKFLAGTDTGVPFVYPGFSLHDELVLFVRAGLTPLQALQTATINPANFLGREKELGTIEKGKLADMIVLDANPLTDIHNTKRIIAVVANGRYLNKASLNKLLGDVEVAVINQ